MHVHMHGAGKIKQHDFKITRIAYCTLLSLLKLSMQPVAATIAPCKQSMQIQANQNDGNRIRINIHVVCG